MYNFLVGLAVGITLFFMFSDDHVEYYVVEDIAEECSARGGWVDADVSYSLVNTFAKYSVMCNDGITLEKRTSKELK